MHIENIEEEIMPGTKIKTEINLGPSNFLN